MQSAKTSKHINNRETYYNINNNNNKIYNNNITVQQAVFIM